MDKTIPDKVYRSFRSRNKAWKRILNHWEFYALLIPIFAIIIIFKYLPMYGVQIAFKDFRPSLGITTSPWAEPATKWFTKFFMSYNFSRLVINTFVLSVVTLLFSFPLPIILALMLNQVPNHKFQRTVQTVVYAPHFISIMVLAGMLHIFLSPYGGLINLVIQALGGESIYFMGSADWFRPVYVISGIWQDTGWGTIIYLATLAGVNTELYEAAKVDGANKLRRVWHIDIPALLPTIIILFIMSFGNLMSVGFEKAYLLQTDLNKATSDIIATYVYEQGVLKTQYGFSTAVGLFNTGINLVLLIGVNYLAKRVGDVSLW